MLLLNVEQQVQGYFRLEKFKTSDDGEEIPGSRTVEADWFPNLILDQGLNQMATTPTYLAACQVGSGSTAPAEGQVALVSRVAGTTTVPSSVDAVSPSAPYYCAVTRTYRFAEGVATGNLAEVGVGAAATGTTLFSRSLIKDSGGNPTTITILADESLDVIYQLRYYAPATDVTGTVVATGNIGGTYDYILRAANVTNSSFATGWQLPEAQTYQGTSLSYVVHDTVIGAVTSRPAGTPMNITAPTSSAYVAGNYYIDRIATATAAQGNFASGIRSFFLKIGIGAYQIQFTPAIPKTNTDVVQLTLRLSWARRP